MLIIEREVDILKNGFVTEGSQIFVSYSFVIPVRKMPLIENKRLLSLGVSSFFTTGEDIYDAKFTINKIK